MLAHHTLVEAPIRSISYLYVVWRDPILQRSFSWNENQWLQLSTTSGCCEANGNACLLSVLFSMDKSSMENSKKLQKTTSKFKISPPKIIQINLLGSQLNPHGLFIFLLIRYHGRLIVYHGALGIIAHGILR